MLHFAPFLSTPFESYTLKPILLFTSFLSKLQFSAVSSIFCEGVRIEPHVHFGSFLSGQTKIKPKNQPLEPHTEHPKHLNTLNHKPQHPKTPKTP